jgi:flavin reductase (DIM6/NTAB) family NADH-FMN oxidoreductase RutF
MPAEKLSKNFHMVDPYEVQDNVFKLLAKDWMLVTAGTPASFNMMTASWGGMGSLWNRLVCFAFVRPQRYTYQFMEKVEFFTLSFFEEKYRDTLNICGTKSGRDVDKVAETGLTPTFSERGAIIFEEARLVMECRKIYAQDITGAHFIDLTIDQKIYASKDYHRMYIGEIVRCLTKK